MLWQNNNSIIIGGHQNTLEEIDSDFVRENNITVARRLSGGGAVYHDLSNLNFTFITAADKQRGIDFSAFCEPIRKALCSLGVPVEFSGRNDLTVEEKKFSGKKFTPSGAGITRTPRPTPSVKFAALRAAVKLKFCLMWQRTE